MIISSDLASCRSKFEALLGKRIVCKTNGGRKRIITYIGTVEHCYNNVFTILARDRDRQTVHSVFQLHRCSDQDGSCVGIMPEKSEELAV